MAGAQKLIWVLFLGIFTHSTAYQRPTFVVNAPGSVKKPSFLQKLFSRRPNYRNALKTQVSQLEAQLQENRDLIKQLRGQVQSLKRTNTLLGDQQHRSTSEAHKAEIAHFQQQIRSLEDELRQIKKLKIDMEKLLKKEEAAVAKLEARLAAAGDEQIELKKKYDIELEKVRQAYEKRMEEKLNELRHVMEEKMELAVAAEKEKAALDRQRAIEETEERMEKETDRRLKSERQKMNEAIAEEKLKMRKLVKAMAKREQKVAEQAGLETAKRSTIGASSSLKKKRKPEVMRSPVK